MIRISVEVGRGATRCRVAAQAESIERALEIVERQNPGCEAKVAFPIDPEVYFVSDTGATTGPVNQEQEVARPSRDVARIVRPVLAAIDPDGRSPWFTRHFLTSCAADRSRSKAYQSRRHTDFSYEYLTSYGRFSGGDVGRRGSG